MGVELVRMNKAYFRAGRMKRRSGWKSRWRRSLRNFRSGISGSAALQSAPAVCRTSNLAGEQQTVRPAERVSVGIPCC